MGDTYDSSKTARSKSTPKLLSCDVSGVLLHPKQAEHHLQVLELDPPTVVLFCQD